MPAVSGRPGVSDTSSGSAAGAGVGSGRGGTCVGEARVDDGAGANLCGEVALGCELVVGGDHAASRNAELRSQVAGRGNALAGQEDSGGDLGAQGRGDLHG